MDGNSLESSRENILFRFQIPLCPRFFCWVRSLLHQAQYYYCMLYVCHCIIPIISAQKSFYTLGKHIRHQSHQMPVLVW